VHLDTLSKSYAQAPSTLSELASTLERAVIYPCTPLAVVRVLQSLESIYDQSQPHGKRLKGKIITVINR
jgi:5,10-methylene-tetrahydrofolate dehydrogenase/methenyl tetrahydrofolate cyclohydrolase